MYPKMNNKPLYNFIIQGLKSLEYDPSPAVAEFFIFYIHELTRWNKVHNLTSITSEKDIAVKHFFDSLLYLKAMPNHLSRLVDIGTGPGFPGIPIKAVKPDLSVTLVEPHRKKCSFLRHLIRESGIVKGTEIINKKVEDIEVPDLYDAAVTRALFSVREFSQKAAPLIKPGGYMIVSKGPGVEKELKEIQNYEIINLKLPFTDIERRIIIMKKDGESENYGMVSKRT